MKYLKIRNWKRYQHYKKRNPPWIKLHYEILSSQDWVLLDDASRVLAITCMLIGSRHEGQIPDDPDYIKRVAYLNKRPNFKPLIQCGFFEGASVLQADASVLQADARPETETETETETKTTLCALGKKRNQEKEKTTLKGFDEWWRHYPKKVARKACRQKWITKNLETQAPRLIEKLSLQVGNDRQWKNGYAPNPLTYLNQERWNDDVQVDQPKVPQIDRTKSYADAKPGETYEQYERRKRQQR